MSERDDERMDALLGAAFATPDPDEEARARAAAVAAFNRIEIERRALIAAERKQTRWRLLVLLGGWIGALALIIRGFVVWPAVAPAVTEVGRSPLISGAAETLSLAPWHLAAGAALLAVTLVFSIRMGVSES